MEATFEQRIRLNDPFSWKQMTVQQIRQLSPLELRMAKQQISEMCDNIAAQRNQKK